MIKKFDEYIKEEWGLYDLQPKLRVKKSVHDMIDIDKKNKKLGTKVTEEDPYGEEVWDVEGKENIVLNNVYKALTDRVGQFGQKPIYDVFLKTDKGNYFLIGDIRYFPKREREAHFSRKSS